jgi:hypothetical protein
MRKVSEGLVNSVEGLLGDRWQGRCPSKVGYPRSRQACRRIRRCVEREISIVEAVHL